MRAPAGHHILSVHNLKLCSTMLANRTIRIERMASWLLPQRERSSLPSLFLFLFLNEQACGYGPCVHSGRGSLCSRTLV